MEGAILKILADSGALGAVLGVGLFSMIRLLKHMEAREKRNSEERTALMTQIRDTSEMFNGTVVEMNKNVLEMNNVVKESNRVSKESNEITKEFIRSKTNA